jgi:hypothetical protein
MRRRLTALSVGIGVLKNRAREKIRHLAHIQAMLPPPYLGSYNAGARFVTFSAPLRKVMGI